ncbi:MAG: ATP-binding protein [Armatimonadetes bacterium]|nr:ATP-binding protein [Armatimonadota bacterium]
MASTFATFKRLKDKGIAALKQGDYVTAKPYLIQAAECMIEISEENSDPKQKAEQEAYAKELIDLARDCGRKAKRGEGKGGHKRDRARDDEEGGADASDWIVKEKPDISFDDIAGLEDVKQDVRLKMIYPFAHPELAGKYGITVGGGVLLYGPPGTGKTMIAKAIAHEIDATFFVVSAAQILSKWVGEAEQNIRKLFEAAKAEPTSVIFLDEIDALVPRRKSESSAVMQRVVPQILQELEGFDRTAERALLFVGATNKPWMLDDAILRPGRLDAKIYVGLPDAPARYRMLELYLGDKPLADDVEFGVLCDRLEGYSGADIRSVAQQSAQRPFLEAVGGKEARPITMADVLSVIEQTPPSVNPADLIRFERFTDGRG